MGWMGDSVDGRNPTPPGMYEPCKLWDKLPINGCSISSINSVTAIELDGELTAFRAFESRGA